MLSFRRQFKRNFKMELPAFLLVIATTLSLGYGNMSITFPQKTETDNAVVVEAQKVVPEPENLTGKEMAHHVANIGLKTLRDLLTEPTNVIVSPFNIYSCLGILDLGSGGETKEELHRLLGPRIGNQSIKDIVGASDGVSYASAVFLDHGFVPKQSFIDTAKIEYEASVLNMNASNGEEAKNSINRWVSEHTNGTIENLLQGRLDPDTRMVILSALLFKGKWLHSFLPAATAPGKFEIDGGTTIEVPLMHMLASVPLVRNLHFDAISLPYQGDHEMKMHVILPKTHGLPALKKLLSHLNANSLRKLRTELSTEEIFIVLPKTKLEGRVSLTNTLKNQGAGSMFNPGKADFTGVVEDGSGLYVSQVYHSIHFEMDEEGTVASAATASILTKSSRFVFRATRPFIFIITDKSDLVLFMGAVVNPQISD